MDCDLIFCKEYLPLTSDTGVCRICILMCHVPEGILDDSWCIFITPSSSIECAAPLCCLKNSDTCLPLCFSLHLPKVLSARNSWTWVPQRQAIWHQFDPEPASLSVPAPFFLTTVSLSYVRYGRALSIATNHNLLAYKTVSACQIQLSETMVYILLSARSNPCSVPDEIGLIHWFWWILIAIDKNIPAPITQCSSKVS